MRVTMVITSFHPVVGGAERQLAQLAQRMQAQGHAVTVVTRRHPGLARRDRIDGAAIHRVGPGRGPRLWRALGFVLAAARAVRSSRPDIVHCHSLHAPVLAGLLGGALAGVPVVAKPLCAGEAAGIAARPLGRQRIALCRRHLAALIAISTEIAQEAQGLGFAPDRIAAIPNGVDAARFHPPTDAAARRASRAALNLPDGFLLAYAGRIAAQKRLPLLCAAFARLQAERPADRPAVTLVIAPANRRAGQVADADAGAEAGADADLRPMIAAAPGVRLLDPVADMPGLLRAVDAFVLPSAREGLSNALLEACASGLPCVAARIDANRPILRDGETGLLFTPDDADDLARCLRRLTDDPALGQRLGVAARAHVLRHFALEETARRLLSLYTTLQAARGHGPSGAGRGANRGPASGGRGG